MVLEKNSILNMGKHSLCMVHLAHFLVALEQISLLKIQPVSSIEFENAHASIKVGES